MKSSRGTKYLAFSVSTWYREAVLASGLRLFFFWLFPWYAFPTLFAWYLIFAQTYAERLLTGFCLVLRCSAIISFCSDDKPGQVLLRIGFVLAIRIR